MSKAIKWDPGRIIEQVRSVCELTSDGCWLWRYGAWLHHGLTDEHVYPRIQIAGVRKNVGNWVLEAAGFPQPPGTEPCHSCDRPPCCNPEHLHWDTHKANMIEMARRGRAGPQRHPERVPRGESHVFRRQPERIPRGPRSGNYASGDGHYTRRDPSLITWRGEAHHQARLSPDRVREIRLRGARGERAEDIAASLGVGRSTVRAVLEGRTWKHVT